MVVHGLKRPLVSALPKKCRISCQNHERVQDPPWCERVAQPSAGPRSWWSWGLHRFTTETQDSLRHNNSLGSQCQGRSLDTQNMSTYYWDVILIICYVKSAHSETQCILLMYQCASIDVDRLDLNDKTCFIHILLKYLWRITFQFGFCKISGQISWIFENPRGLLEEVRRAQV